MAHDLNTNKDSDDVMIVDWSTYGYISTHPSLNLQFIQKEEQSKIKQEEKIIIKSAENLAYSLEVHNDDDTGIDAGSGSLFENRGSGLKCNFRGAQRNIEYLRNYCITSNFLYSRRT